MKKSFLMLMLLNIAFCNINAVAKPLQIPDSFPLPMTFRAFGGVKQGTELFKQRLNEQLPYSFIHAPEDEKAIIIRKYWPNKIITLQDAYGGIGEKSFNQVWPGHLLYKAGTLLTQDISPQDQLIQVEDISRIAKNKKHIAKEKFPHALIVYALDDKGQPDWSQAEHVVLKDIKNGNLVIQRGQWGTKPLAFKAGKAVVAGHMMYWSQQWQLNLSLDSPRGGKDNLTAAEWKARRVAQRILDTNADGVEFDVGRWTWGSPKNNPMDVNNDRIADYGYIGGVNSFGLGGQVLFRELRKLVGADKLIQVDSNDAMTGVRGWKYLNGVQLESFPMANDFDRFSQAFLHLRLWTENAEGFPRVSYPFTKLATTTFSGKYLPDGASTDFRFRIGFASACLLGMPHAFASAKNDASFDPANPSKGNAKEANQRFGVFSWDEYHGGDLNDWHWLGRPLNPAQQDFTDLDKTNLLAKTQWQWSADKGFTAEPHQEPDSFSTNIQSIPQGILPHDSWFGVRLEPKGANLPVLAANREYTLEFEARGDDSWHYAGQDFEKVPRMITIKGDITGKGNKPLSVLVDAEWKTYRLSFISDGSRVTTPVFGVSEQIGSTGIRNIKLYAGGAERWSREFEKGLVLLNMTNDPWSVSVPKGKYKRLKGKQDPEINTGEIIESNVVIPARDALFLIKNSSNFK